MAHDPFDLNSPEDARALAEEKARAVMRVEKDDLLWLMRSKQGRRIAHRILDRAGVFRSSFHTNALQMAFNEGTRNEGLAFLAKLMDYCPEQYSMMLKEQREDV